MKKVIAFVMVLVMLLGLGNAFALELSGVNDLPMVTLTEDESLGVAFIDCDASIDITYRTFSHIYDSPTYANALYSDIVILNYNTEDAYPLLRTWILYEATKNINANSCTITVGDTAYTLSDIGRVGNADYCGMDEEGAYEIMMIVYGSNTLDFINALYNYVTANFLDSNYDVTVPAVLHGDEDVSFEICAASLMDFCAVVTAYEEIGGFNYFTVLTDTTPCTAETVAAE